MKNTDKSVYVITEPSGYVGAFTNMKLMFKVLESRNNAGTCDSETVWEDFLNYSQCLSLKKKQGKEGFLFSLTLYPIVSFAESITITETYLNR